LPDQPANNLVPGAAVFFALKSQYDPQELFQNQFYREYGRNRRNHQL
jgi:hypothetical protein